MAAADSRCDLLNTFFYVSSLPNFGLRVFLSRGVLTGMGDGMSIYTHRVLLQRSRSINSRPVFFVKVSCSVTFLVCRVSGGDPVSNNDKADALLSAVASNFFCGRVSPPK